VREVPLIHVPSDLELAAGHAYIALAGSRRWPVAIHMTWTASPITSRGRPWPS